MHLGLSRSAPSALVQSKAVLTRPIFQKRVAGLSLKQQLWLQAALEGAQPEDGFQGEFKALANPVEAQSLLRELSLVKSALARGEIERRVPRSRECYWSKIQRAILESGATEPLDTGRPAGRDAGVLGILRKDSIMKTSNRLWREIACGGLSLALVSGVGLPISAWAASNSSSEKSNPVPEHRQELRAMHEKMMAEAKAEDAALEKMVAELNKAPEAKKADLEAAILTKLVAQHHRILGEWESLHARMEQFRNEHMQMGKTETSDTSVMHGMMGQNTPAAHK